MIIEKNRLLSYLLSLLLLIFLINSIPASQPIKYILFIFINFFIITFQSKINFYKKKNLFTGIFFFFNYHFIFKLFANKIFNESSKLWKY